MSGTTKRNKAALLASSITLAFGVSSASQAQAQSTSPTQPASSNPTTPVQPASSNASVGGEIIVTAQKRSESSQKVPIAISAFDGAALSKAGISDVQSLASRIPNFNFGEQFNNARIAIRGVSLESLSLGAEGNVAYNLDDIYIARPAAQTGNFYDIARVEVLRGPQGTLYGRNATGGAFNVYTNRPTDYWTGYGQITYGNYNDMIAEAAVGGPIAQGVAFRVAAFGENRDGYGKNVTTGNDIDDDNTRAARLSLAFKPASNFSIDVIGDISRRKDHSGDVHPLAQGGLTGEPGSADVQDFGTLNGGMVIFNSRDVSENADPQYYHKGAGVTVDAKLNLGDVALRSLTGYRYSNARSVSDVDGSTLPLAEILLGEKSREFTQEFNLNYSHGPIDFTGGLYYFHENDKGFEWIPGLLAPNLPNGQVVANYAIGGTLKSDGYAGYGQLNWHFTDQLTLVAGARYGSERKTDYDLFTNYFTETKFLVPVDLTNLNDADAPLSGPFVQSKRFNAFTPKVGLNFQATPKTLLYASISKGFRAGTFNLGGTNIVPTASGLLFENPPVNPETVWDYEAGIKTRTLDNKLRLNVAGFLYNYKNLQLTKIVGDAIFLTNAAAARIYGIELDGEYRATPQLTVNFGGGWLHARFTDYFNEDIARPGLGFQNLAGNPLPQAPDFSANGGFDYTVPVGRDRLTFELQGNYRSRFYFDEYHRKILSQAGFAKFDASLTYRNIGGFEVAAFIKNISNIKTIASAYQSSAIIGLPVNGYFDPPRTFGVRARYNF